MLLQKRWFVASYWVAAVVLVGVAGALGARWGDGEAPNFDNDDKGGVPATGMSHLLYQVFGGILLAALVLAIFSGVWLLMWMRARRAAAAADDGADEVIDEDEMSVDDVEHMFDDEDDDSEPDDVEADEVAGSAPNRTW
ncbi:hypothetical protein [Rudaeicoccus suwonensis]|uniref:Uncharacterized protein n=1 Tax=Rudaeicoccus suwonensis TaxID=657409 RepID=A0A561E8F4_9MICO|nr:hypothetical protein [Rudaeicoccus suwonensis]TWE11876.1 hypothetical protein BKA23_0669 [Rudaeicoccus suwonensis]